MHYPSENETPNLHFGIHFLSEDASMAEVDVLWTPSADLKEMVEYDTDGASIEDAEKAICNGAVIFAKALPLLFPNPNK